MKKPYLSIIIPAYNEEKRISKTILDINQRLKDVDYDYEILVVDDGSFDKTKEVVSSLMSQVKNLKLIENERNHGKGFVVRQGMLQAQGEIRLFTDADNSTTIDHFEKMRPYFSQGYQVVIASRDIEGSVLEPPQPFYRRFLGDLGNLFIQFLVLWGIKDTQCGFKAFTEEVALKIFSLAKINGFAFDVEILALAKKLGYQIKEIPVLWQNNRDSRVSLKSYFLVFKDVLKIRFWLWFNVYHLK